MPAPYKIFTIYAREDAAYLEELRGQLRPLENAGRIKVWSDREINPGVDWEQEIVHNLDTADIILILVSAAYYNSAYIHEKEIKYALARHEQGQAKVLPIIVRPVDFSDDPVISRLQVLPTDGKPVNDRRHWQERDDAWLDVVSGIKRTLAILVDAENRREQQARGAILAVQQEQENKLQAEKKEAERLKKNLVTAEKREQEALIAAQETARKRPVSMSQKPINNPPANQQKPLGKPLGQVAPRKDTSRLPPVRYAFWIGGIVVALLGLWLTVDFFKEKKPEGVHALPSSSLPENVGVKMKKSGLGMEPVEGGTFMMGSPVTEAGRTADECQHRVTVPSFSMGRYEVTQADWRSIMGNDPSNFKNCDDCPVEQVSWIDVQDFLQKLNAKYPGKNFRLPTEAEWEYAARSSNKNGSHLYAGSEDPGTVAWYAQNSDSKTHPVGSKAPNELGLYDMSGNVSEWCHDSYQAYSCDKNSKPDLFRVLRGGGCLQEATYCRTADRFHIHPSFRYRAIGFRLVSVSL
ncbi:MAG: SUMF1/EgtB/PvdO family nonheme iron enzyme [Saprospiraceae bacterium]